jgi:C-terminal processing protease CtpA/Prc
MEGVGIVLDVDPDAHHPVVVSLVPGKAADGCKRIGVGDRLVAVAGQATQGKTFNEVRDLIVGPVGSTVRLNFQGSSGDYQCDLVRGSAPPPPQPEFIEAEEPAHVRPASAPSPSLHARSSAGLLVVCGQCPCRGGP